MNAKKNTKRVRVRVYETVSGHGYNFTQICRNEADARDFAAFVNSHDDGVKAEVVK